MTGPNRNLKEFKLDHLANKIQAAREARDQAKQLIAFADGIEEEIKAIVGKENAKVTVFGVPMYTYQDKDAYAWRQFQDTHPHIAQQFMIEKTVRELDKDAVKREFGDLLGEFQTREFRTVSQKPGA